MNIILIGFMGAGKTTVGKRLAEKMGYSFLDTDEYIERREKMSISQIFSVKGEVGFREAEKRALQEICQRKNTVIATGGGLPLKEENRNCLRNMGTVIYLDVDEEVLWQRLRLDESRPLLAGQNPREKIHDLLRQREAIYRESAHWIVPVKDEGAWQLAEEIEKIVKSA